MAMTESKVDLGEYVGQLKNNSNHQWLNKLTKKGAWLGKGGWLKGLGERESLEQVEASAANDPLLPSLSRQQRMTGFLGCFVLGVVCLGVAACYIPVLALRSRKFAILFTVGSLAIIVSLAILRGPATHLRSMLHSDRLPFSTFYFISVLATLYVALSMQSTLLTIFCGLIQLAALTWYTLTYIPGGQTGMRFFFKAFTRTATATAASSGLKLDA